MNDDRCPDVTESDLWHALTELIRCQPNQQSREIIITAAVRTALSEAIAREKDVEVERQRPEPPISEHAEKVLTKLAPDPPFSLPRLQRAVGLRNLEKELDHWPTERHGEILKELRKGLERRRNALGEVKPQEDWDERDV